MLPFDIAEIHGAIALAYKVIEIGWSDAHNAHTQYNEFREDVESLKENLENLVTIINRAQRALPHNVRPSTATSRGVNNVIGNFRGALEDCWNLLEKRATNRNRQGAFYNFQWFLLVKDDVQILRDRISFCNIKLSVALRCLELERQDGTRQLLWGIAEFMDQRFNEFERAAGIRPGEEPERPLEMPRSIRNYLGAITTSRYGDLRNIPVEQGIDETVFYLDRATQWHRRRRSPDSSPPCRASRLYNIFRAYALLQATKTATPPVNYDEFERYFPRLGMTVQRFMQKLGERILAAHDSFMGEEGEMPTEVELWDIIEAESNIWEEHHRWRPRQQEDDDPRQGELVFKCRLQDFNAVPQHLEVWQHNPNCNQQLTVITCGANRPDRIYQVDLATLQLAPSDEAFASASDRFSVTLNPVKNSQQQGFKLAFHRRGGLFLFQQFITGYKVVDDFSGTTVISQRAGVMFGGERRTEIARVQLWSSTFKSAGRVIPPVLLRQSTSTLRNLPSSGSSEAPILPQLDSFSTLTLSPTLDSNSTPTTSPSSSTPSVDVQPNPFGSSSPRAQTAAIHRTTGFGASSNWNSQVNESPRSSVLGPHSSSWRAPSRAFESRPGATSPTSLPSPIRTTGHRTSGGSWAQPAQISPPQRHSPPSPVTLQARINRRPSIAKSLMSQFSKGSTISSNLVQVDTSGTLGVIIDAPDPARLVLFLKDRTQFGAHSLLVIDIDENIIINPNLCDCRPEDPTRASAQYQIGRPPNAISNTQQPTCNKVVIQARDSKTISARETRIPLVSRKNSGSGYESRGSNTFWNLASAGRYQPDGEGLDKVDRLRLVTIEFETGVEARKAFVKHFNDLRQVYMQNAAV